MRFLQTDWVLHNKSIHRKYGTAARNDFSYNVRSFSMHITTKCHLAGDINSMNYEIA